MNTAQPHVSIIVPVLNRAASIELCLEALTRLDYPSYDIIVVDNGSTDNTTDVVKRYAVTLLHEPVRSPYVARNTGLRHARGPLVLFIDSDCVASGHLLTHLVSTLVEQGSAGVGGPLQTHDPATLVEAFGHHAGILQYTFPRGPLPWNRNKFLSGAIFASNAMFRKDVLEELNNFDADFTSGGDYDLCWRLQRAGHTIYFDPDAVVYHIHRGNTRNLVRQFYKFGLEQPRLLKKQPEGKSFLKIKTFIFPHWEIAFRSPVRMLVNIDCCTLLPVALLASPLYPPLLYVAAVLALAALAGAGAAAARVAWKTRELKWLALYPFFHLLRDYAFTIGRIRGGFIHRILSF